MLPSWRFRPAVYEADALNPEIALAPWAGHRQFAYDYVANIRPGVVVELGVFHGCAFFSFCQAAKDEGLDWMRLYAVDNWIGNAHDTFYGEEVFETFQKVCDACFPSLRTVALRKQFEDAAADFEDGSIDLLHIDGFHTYEAVAQDYRTWLPKLADEGVMFLHDVFTERHGTTRFWRELSLDHPSLLFEHAFGLGLLFPKGDRLYRHLLEVGLPQLALFYTRIGELETAVPLARMHLQHEAEARERGLVQARDEALRKARDLVAQSEALVAQSRADAAQSRADADRWWQTAMDLQWRIDNFEGEKS